MDPNTSIRFSPATGADEDNVIQLMQEFYAIEHLNYSEAVARDGLRQLWSSPLNGSVYLLHAEDALAGYVVLTFGFSLEFHGRYGLVDELYLRESFRGRGLGAACLQWVAEVCRAGGMSAIRLEVDYSNSRAKSLYHSMGFEVHDRYLLTRWIAESARRAE